MAQTDGAGEELGGSNLQEPEYDVEVKLSDIQADPNNPLYSIKSFDELGLLVPTSNTLSTTLMRTYTREENILKGIYQMRFQRPSKIQEALPLYQEPSCKHDRPISIWHRQDCSCAQYLVSSRYVSYHAHYSPALCLAPSRELARQIMGVVQVMGSFIEGLTVSPAIPMDASMRGRKIEGQVVVGTPGTVMDMVKRRTWMLATSRSLYWMRPTTCWISRVWGAVPSSEDVSLRVTFGLTSPQLIVARSMLPKSVQIVLSRPPSRRSCALCKQIRSRRQPDHIEA
jgi:ATP-dependent RNA helicase DDX19/DBP5